MIKRSKFLLRVLALLSIMALVVAACGDDDAEEDTTTTTTTSAPVETTPQETTTTTEAEEAPMAGALGQVVVPDGESVQVRSLNAITGDVAFLGVPNERGVLAAISDFGPVKGFSVDMGTGLDDLCSADGGQAAAQTIVADERVVGVIGTSCSGAAVAASPLISDAGMVMISASNTSPSLTSDLAGTAGSDFHPGYYRTAHNDLFQGEAVANYAFGELGLRAVAAVHDGDSYTNGLATAFADAFRGLGGEVPVFTAVNKGDTDMVPVLTEVAAGSPDGIFFPIFPPEGNFIAQQIGQVSGLSGVTLFSADGMLVENFLEIPESSGVYFSGPNLQFEGNVNQATGVSAAGFLESYNADYGEAPSAAFWAHAYDATTLLLTAIDQASTVFDGELYIDRQGVRDALNNVSGFSGLIGTLSCDGFGDCGSGAIQIVQQTPALQTDSTKLPVLYAYSPAGSSAIEPMAGALGQVVVPDGESVQVRSLNAITGDVAFLGVPNERGVLAAISDFGPVKGFSVDMGTGLDDLCSADGGQAAAQTIVADERVVGVIGTSCSGAAVAASPLISDAGMVMISASNTSPSLTSDLAGTAGSDFHPGYYRTAHNDLFQGEAVANYAFGELGLRAVAAVHDGDSYTNGLATAFADAFRGLGGEVPVFTAVNKGDTDMVPVLTEVAAGSPDGIFFPIFPPEGNFIAQQIGQVSGLSGVTLFSADGMLVENFLEIPESSGVYFSGPNLQFEGNVNQATGVSAAGFLESYNADYGEAPSAAFWAHAYDATTLLLTAIDQASTVFDGELYIDRQGVRDALNNVSGFSGLIGTLSCDGFGDCGSGAIQIVQQTDDLETDSTKLPVLYEFIPGE